MESDQTPQEEAADWAAWLDRFERHIWPVFEVRGYTRDAAAIVYFTRIPAGAATVEDDDE